MPRFHFYHTVLRENVSGNMEPVPDVEARAFPIDANAIENPSEAPIFASPTGSTAGNPFSDPGGVISFFLNGGDYRIYIADTESPVRILDFSIIVGHASGAPLGISKSQLVAAVQEALFSPGDIKMTSYTSLQSGWLFCDGSAVHRITYAALFAVIGTEYGSGDGSTTFNVPDLRGRVPVGVDGGGGRLTANDTLGDSSGAETVALTAANLPSFVGEIVGIGGASPDVAGYGVDASGAPEAFVPYDVAGGGGFFSTPYGSNTPHANMPPYQIINFMIKT
jgi:microcystin-dependent protein